METEVICDQPQVERISIDRLRQLMEFARTRYVELSACPQQPVRINPFWLSIYQAYRERYQAALDRVEYEVLA